MTLTLLDGRPTMLALEILGAAAAVTVVPVLVIWAVAWFAYAVRYRG
jgi:hypothetical protein